jgi:hypothetical protein
MQAYTGKREMLEQEKGEHTHRRHYERHDHDHGLEVHQPNNCTLIVILDIIQSFFNTTTSSDCAKLCKFLPENGDRIRNVVF